MGPKCGTPQGRDWHRRRNEDPCEPCRLAWNEVCRERRKAAVDKGWVRPDRPTPRRAECVDCGKTLRRCLSEIPRCRACIVLERQRLARAETRRRSADRRLRLAAEGTSSQWTWVAGECAQCLLPFVRHGQASRFCSSGCRRKARASWKIATRDRIAIYERDGWVCQLCGDPVNRALMSTDPGSDWAPSLDHIEPQAWALIPDHSPTNLRLAHRWCNSVRGDLRYYTDDDLAARGRRA